MPLVPVVAPSSRSASAPHPILRSLPELLATPAGLPLDRPQSGSAPELIYRDDRAQVLRGDSALLGLALPPGAVDLVITSPPYSLGIDYGKAGYDDDQPYLGYLEWVRTWSQALLEASAHGGRACVNIPLDSNKGGKRAVYADYLRIFQEVGWTYQTSIVWNEQNISRRTAWGSWLSPSAPFVTAPVEMIAVFYKGAWRRPATGGQRGDIMRDEFLAWTLGMWTFPGANATRVGHPAPFPEELPRRLIKLYSYPDDLVLDPFLGSGTTAVAAVKLGRRALGVEINPRFCELSARNLATVAGPAVPVLAAAS